MHVNRLVRRITIATGTPGEYEARSVAVVTLRSSREHRFPPLEVAAPGLEEVVDSTEVLLEAG
jgi:hypothetical protein